MIDVIHRISAVARTVGTRTLEAGEARVITVARSFPDPVEEVWDACTTAERIQRWLMPVSGELRLGGRYQLRGQRGRGGGALRSAALVRRHVGVRR